MRCFWRAYLFQVQQREACRTPRLCWRKVLLSWATGGLSCIPTAAAGAERQKALSMPGMERANVTQAMLAAEPRGTERGSGNEYFYILIVMSFYGIFLMGIMLGYIKSKRKERKSNLLLLYKDEEREWGEAAKPLPTVSGLKPVQMPMMLNVLQESVVPSLSCAICSMEGSSVSSDSSSPDVHFTIQEEVLDAELGEVSETLLNESSEGSAENLHKNS